VQRDERGVERRTIPPHRRRKRSQRLAKKVQKLLVRRGGQDPLEESSMHFGQIRHRGERAGAGGLAPSGLLGGRRIALALAFFAAPKTVKQAAGAAALAVGISAARLLPQGVQDRGRRVERLKVRFLRLSAEEPRTAL
jgi:hypothetical protein